MVNQTGFTVKYAYDADGRLSELTDGGGHMIVAYTYDADGRLSRKTNGNGTYTTYAYDADGNLLHLVNDTSGGAVNSRFDYTYNALGLETSEATQAGTWTYTYDADGQLIHAVFASTNSSIPSQDLAYSYDAMGNRITTVINGVTTAYTTNNLNETTSVGGVKDTYDADGNLISDGANTYTYNSLNQLIGVTGPGGTTTYTYNALGQRVASTTGGQTTEYLIDPSGLGNIVGQYTGSGTLIADYTYGLGLTSQVTAQGSDYYDFDGLGSTVGLTNSSQTDVNSYAYTPFGGSLSSTQAVANPFQFLGEWGVVNDGNGLDDMRARAYDSSLGQFTSSDPIGAASGQVGATRLCRQRPRERRGPRGTFRVPDARTGGGGRRLGRCRRSRHVRGIRRRRAVVRGRRDRRRVRRLERRGRRRLHDREHRDPGRVPEHGRLRRECLPGRAGVLARGHRVRDGFRQGLSPVAGRAAAVLFRGDGTDRLSVL